MCSPHTPSKKEHKMNQEKKCTARGSTIWLIQLVKWASIFNGYLHEIFGIWFFLYLLRNPINEHPTSFALQMEYKLSTNRKLSWSN